MYLGVLLPQQWKLEQLCPYPEYAFNNIKLKYILLTYIM